MGNCIKAVDPMIASIPQSINVDTTPLKASNLPIIFLIGGPGVGKRTLCTKVAEKYDFCDIYTTDLLRQEVAMRTERSLMLARIMSQGQLIPINVLIDLVTMEMLESMDKKKGFIMCGFPRQKEQGKVFDRVVREPDLVLFLRARNSILGDRIMARMVTTTERLTFNFDSIKKQIKQFHRRNRGIVKYYKHLIVMIDGEPDVMTVYENVCQVIDNMLLKFPTTSTASTGVDSNNVVTVNKTT